MSAQFTINAMRPANQETRRYAILLLQERDVTPAVKAKWLGIANNPEASQREVGNLVTVLKMAAKLSQEEAAQRMYEEDIREGIALEDAEASAPPRERDLERIDAGEQLVKEMLEQELRRRAAEERQAVKQ